MLTAILASIVLAAAAAEPSAVQKLDAEVDAGLARVMRENWSAATSLVYTEPLDRVQKLDFYTDGFRRHRSGADYGVGLEDCAIVNGLLLSALCDRYEVTREESLRPVALKVARGLVNLATLHRGTRGFIARGICPDDAKSICTESSMDQHTHALHGLWRYWRSPLRDASVTGDVSRVVREVGERMLAEVIEANGWCYLKADRSGPDGIGKMRFNWPHEGARLSMFYAVAWDVTGEARFRELYRRYLDEGLTNSMRLATAEGAELAKFRSRMPDYAYLQMLTSLETLYAVTEDAAAKSRIRAAMTAPAGDARRRAVRIDGGETRFLCGAGETLLTQLMTPGFGFGPEQEALLRKAIAFTPFATEAKPVRVIHLYAAWWRWRRVVAESSPREAL